MLPVKAQEALPVCLATCDVYGFCAENWLPGALGGRGTTQKRGALGPNSDIQFQRAKLFLLFQFRPTSLGYLTSSSVSFLSFCPAWLKEPLNAAAPIAQEREDPVGHSGTWPSPWEHPPANGPSVTMRLLLRRKTRWPFWSWETVFLPIILESGNDSLFSFFHLPEKTIRRENSVQNSYNFFRTPNIPTLEYNSLSLSLSLYMPRCSSANSSSMQLIDKHARLQFTTLRENVTLDRKRNVSFFNCKMGVRGLMWGLNETRYVRYLGLCLVLKGHNNTFCAGPAWA